MLLLLLLLKLLLQVGIYTVFQKTCDRVFDEKLFGALITKTMDHHQVVLFSHVTYLVQLLYLGKLSRSEYYEFNLTLLIFQMLQHWDIECKTVTVLFYLLIIQLTVCKRKIKKNYLLTIRLFIMV